MSVRAGVRCHVNANYGGEAHYALDKARMYLEAAHRFLDLAPASLTAVGGLSGSGKSTRARQLAPLTGRAPGAVVLRSDEIRKRLWACPEFEALPREAYTPDENARVYAHMFDLARTTLGAGQAVILDATFREPKWRVEAEHLAPSVPFAGRWLDLPVEVRRARVEARLKDVSDATPEVAAAQADIDVSTVSWHIEGS